MGRGCCKEVELDSCHRVSAAVLAPPSHSTASPPVPQPWHSPDKPSIPEMVLEFWRCLQWRLEPAGAAWSLEIPGGRGDGSPQPCPWERRIQGSTHTLRNYDISGKEAGPQWVAPPARAHTYHVPHTDWMLGSIYHTESTRKGMKLIFTSHNYIVIVSVYFCTKLTDAICMN